MVEKVEQSYFGTLEGLSSVLEKVGVGAPMLTVKLQDCNKEFICIINFNKVTTINVDVVEKHKNLYIANGISSTTIFEENLKEITLFSSDFTKYNFEFYIREEPENEYLPD